jgi:hypothetical protein
VKYIDMLCKINLLMGEKMVNIFANMIERVK